MIGINELQYGGMLTTALMALTLVLQVPRRAIRNKIFSRARWMMAVGLALISLQFLVQYIGGYRQMGVTQGVFWNLIFFMPCTICMNIALLYVQQKGHIKRLEWLLGVLLYVMALVLLVTTSIADGIPFEEESAPLRTVEYIGAALFLAMEGHYFVQLYKGYQRMRHAVDNYFDHERDDLLGWMGRSVTMLAVITMFVPFAIFQEGWLLSAFACAFFFIIYYCASCFHSYGISQDAQRVEEAERSQDSDEIEPTLGEADIKRVEKAVDKWVAAGGYLQPNQTLSTVASDMDVQRYMLKAWLQQTKYGKLSNWLNTLRTEEAQRTMMEHPDWNLNAIADHCGFSRSTFHRVFHEITGETPSRYQERARID